MASVPVLNMDPAPLLAGVVRRGRSRWCVPFLASGCCPSSLCVYFRRHPLRCLHSLLLFNQLSVLSYLLLCLHLLLLYAATFYLFFALHVEASLPGSYVVYLSFAAVRSLAHLVFVAVRLWRPQLWGAGLGTGEQRLALSFLTFSRLLSVAFFIYGALYWALLTEAGRLPTGALGLLPVVPLMLVRDALALLLPACAVLWLRLRVGLGESEVSQFLPYVALRSGDGGSGAVAGALWPAQVEVAEKRRGLSEEELARLSAVAWPREGSANAEVDATCAICLAEMEEGERVRVLPSCGHAFHGECADSWLRIRRTCPLCVTVVTAPLAEPQAVAVTVEQTSS